MSFARRAHHTEEFNRVLEDLKLIKAYSGHIDLVNEGEGVFDEDLVQSLV